MMQTLLHEEVLLLFGIPHVVRKRIQGKNVISQYNLIYSHLVGHHECPVTLLVSSETCCLAARGLRLTPSCHAPLRPNPEILPRLINEVQR